MSEQICAACVGEPHLASKIGNGSDTGMDCDFCGRSAPTAEMASIVEACAEVLDIFFEETSNTRAVKVYDQTPAGERLLSVLEELFKDASDNVRSAIERGLHETWPRNFLGEPKYDNDPWFIPRKKRTGKLDAEWREMEHSLRTEARLVNPRVNKLLEQVFGRLREHATRDGESPIGTIGPGTSIETLFRARAFPDEWMLEHALRHVASELGPHQPGKGRANRMNAQGVSVFYGATLAKIAIAEVRPPVGSWVLVGGFRIIRPLRLLDLDKLKALDVDPSMSRFHPTTQEVAQRNAFLAWLSGRLEMPVMPENEGDGYLITQAVADFLSTHEELDIDGIVFKSVQYQGRGADIHRNVVLFNKAARVEHAEPNADGGVHIASLYESDEEEEYFWPTIIVKDQHEIRPLGAMEGGGQDRRTVTLRVAFEELKVCQVKGADYQTEDADVTVQPADLRR